MFNYSYNKRDLFDAVKLPIAHVFLDANTPPGTLLIQTTDLNYYLPKLLI
jgi:hypothetical protein